MCARSNLSGLAALSGRRKRVLTRVTDEWCESMGGKKLRVIVEGYDRLAECCYGRSQGEAPDIDGKIFFDTDGKKFTMGEFTTVEITDFMGCDLVGKTTE